MNTDRSLRDLNSQVYNVDRKYDTTKIIVDKKDSRLERNELNEITAGGVDYKVISTENGRWGFQGMAVAPIINGKPDYNQVTVVAAGTDPNDKLDVLEALDGATNIGSLQEPVAEKFVEKITSEHPDWKITQLTGYSQSAYMLKVGAKYQIPTVTFNGWFQYGTLTSEEKNFMKNNPNFFTNYRKKEDAVTWWNDFNSSSFNSDDFGTVVWLAGKSHHLADWQFDKTGMIILPDNPETQSAIKAQKERLLQVKLAKRMSRLTVIKRQLTASGGGLSTNEKLYLDSEAARIIVQKLSSDFKIATEKLIAIYQKAIIEAQELWQNTLYESRSMGPLLPEWEVRETLQMVGFTEQTIITNPCHIYQDKLTKIMTVASDFDRLTTEITAKISEIVQRDSELAYQLKGI
ncbi:MAG: hypothetical protein IJI90_06245 [Carnobacterium sp.]|uniref:Uncharacterized protein n=1 Tax=Pseudolactococcus piscium MKFS47 TaxID=297352 RepID=A0A0D6DXD3_9LACT|nr:MULTISPECIES: hypothetical protein [Lactobacillales]MBQ6484588.1 hypothetical protein [Carnobacterium sp.]MCJ1968288.1 hypothetical protein [Lactococcus carnosus]MCJ1972516.1 hypothetical protein [Lactococcus carnosus]MCJ2001434.1 hypothetical protein [Lactococcus carnosus]CEN28434.1 Uncharacterized protein LACPI_1234 [Lactococcus piscium MKFS47]